MLVFYRSNRRRDHAPQARQALALFRPDGTRIADAGEVARLNKLGVPPAYVRVWFSPDPAGHLQAVGYDAKGRKQYRYHETFAPRARPTNTTGAARSARRCRRLRAAVERDIAVRGPGPRQDPRRHRPAARSGPYPRRQRLLRRGERELRRDDPARPSTAKSAAPGSELEYRGKSGKMQRVVIADASLAKVVRRCHDLPGQALFQYLGDDGEPHRIGSGDVNAYIKAAMGEDFSAKHFRTWGASVIAFEAIRGGAATLKAVLAPVAAALGNTPAISRKSYVHPALIAAVNDGRAEAIAAIKLPRPTKYLTAVERGLIAPYLSAS